MSVWFRSWAGAPTDAKWGVVAAAVGCKPIEVSGVVWALLDYASLNEDRGSLIGFPIRVFAHTSGLNSDLIKLIIAELSAEDLGVISGDRFSSWEKRQPKREDSSTERVRKHRERGETHGNAPEIDTDTEIDKSEDKLHSNATREPISDAVTTWNDTAALTGWPTVTRISDKRRQHVRNRLREHKLDGWQATIERARSSPYLAGADPPPWFTFDWISKPENFLKVSEGNYDHRQSPRYHPSDRIDRRSGLARAADEALARLGHG